MIYFKISNVYRTKFQYIYKKYGQPEISWKNHGTHLSQVVQLSEPLVQQALGVVCGGQHASHLSALQPYIYRHCLVSYSFGCGERVRARETRFKSRSVAGIATSGACFCQHQTAGGERSHPRACLRAIVGQKKKRLQHSLCVRIYPRRVGFNALYSALLALRKRKGESQ